MATISLKIRADSVVLTELVAALLGLCLVLRLLHSEQTLSLSDLHGMHATAVADLLQATFFQGS